MITGKIRDERVAIIEIEVIGLNQRAKIEATVDTGFTTPPPKPHALACGIQAGIAFESQKRF